jgi:hypothetical protein
MTTRVFLKTQRHDVPFRVKMQETGKNSDLDLKRTDFERFTTQLVEFG